MKLVHTTTTLRSYLIKLLSKRKVLFLEYLEKMRGYSDLTIESYDESIKEALSVVEILEEESTITINIMPYRIKISHLNAKTVSKKLSAIRSFALFLNENGLHVVLESDDSIKVSKTLPKPISHEHILEALELADIQEKLVITMLYTLGLRVSELASLKHDDIYNGWVRVLGKGSKQRDIPLITSTKKVLDEYLTTFGTNKFLFHKNGEKLSENSLRYIITKVFKRVGMKVTPHQLRHSYATALLNGGAPIVDVSELLGHSSMATTQIYTKLGSALKQQNYNKAHPLCKVGEF